MDCINKITYATAYIPQGLDRKPSMINSLIHKYPNPASGKESGSDPFKKSGSRNNAPKMKSTKMFNGLAPEKNRTTG